uniref:Reverse transcriptase domain-containing protein n=1 Tax=Lactuca sativa TaxID=4236 RepID=A0A9R1VIU7_LACSA|nr:hypothetical protein LSAT_V11C500272200 [Lactuca sativa]
MKQVVWRCGGDKSPCLEGYTFKILKHKWELIKYDVIHFVSHFKAHGQFVMGCNPSFITLILKVKYPLNLGDYRPISLIGCMYKIFAKVLALGLKLVVGLVVEEGYLDSIMEQMGFNSKWRRWIHSCLSSSITFILINGSPSDEFPITKGVRQGDPLPPFLFIMAMEDLNVAIKTSLNKSIMHGLSQPHDGTTLSHIFYTYDAIFIGK